MPPKRAPTTTSSSRGLTAASQTAQGQSSMGQVLRSGYDTVTARENQSVVRAVGMFGVGPAIHVWGRRVSLAL